MIAWGWLLAAWAAGVLTVPVVVAAVAWLSWATSRTTGTYGCNVCEHAPVSEIGERTNLAVWAGRQWHALWWARRRWHRDAWAAHPFNPRRRDEFIDTHEFYGD